MGAVPVAVVAEEDMTYKERANKSANQERQPVHGVLTLAYSTHTQK